MSTNIILYHCCVQSNMTTLLHDDFDMLMSPGWYLMTLYIKYTIALTIALSELSKGRLETSDASVFQFGKRVLL